MCTRVALFVLFKKLSKLYFMNIKVITLGSTDNIYAPPPLHHTETYLNNPQMHDSSIIITRLITL